MKKTLLIILLALLGVTQAVAQWALEYVPTVREGVKWVNEKVIVNHGDTTSYYYTYEILGKKQICPEIEENPDDGCFEMCHYYTGSQIDPDNDSIISILHEGGGGIDSFNNWPYQRICAENRNMIKRSCITIYDFDILYMFSYAIPGDMVSNYVYNQTEPQILTTDNLIIADPIVIDGKLCQRRLAYIGEQGDTLAYVVESIGFDSYDMGDLLTPFTRKPDPNADYQEWCGLSHVVKDGKIIYKGMRYREGAFDGVDEVVAEPSRSPQETDSSYYNLMGKPVGKDVPTTPGIYIHQGKKIVVR